MHNVFVYGTLKRGFPNHHLMPEAEFRGTARTSDRLPLVIAGKWCTPILIAASGGHRVNGEVYGVDDDGLSCLDDLEGNGRELGFDRIDVEVDLSGAWTIAFTYVMPRDRIYVIHSEPLEEYQLDPRYVSGHQRGQPSSGFGSPSPD